MTLSYLNLSSYYENISRCVHPVYLCLIGPCFTLCCRLGRNVDAYNAATEAGTLHAQLKDANFTIEGNDESTEFRPLVPLGYQFKADMYADLFGDETAQKELGKSTLEIDDVISAYTVAVNTAPLNTSRKLSLYILLHFINMPLCD